MIFFRSKKTIFLVVPAAFLFVAFLSIYLLGNKGGDECVNVSLRDTGCEEISPSLPVISASSKKTAEQPEFSADAHKSAMQTEVNASNELFVANKIDNPVAPEEMAVEELAEVTPEAEGAGIFPSEKSQQEQFELEEVDSHWAVDAENFYIQLFSDAESLAGFVLSEAKCKAIHCKLSFLVTGAEQKDDITNALVEKLLMQSEEIQISIDQSSSDGKAILYVQNLGEL